MGTTYREEKHIKYCLASALIELMKQSSFEEITVNEICYEAHVGRATFYHYVKGKQGKEDLLSFKLERDFGSFVEKRRTAHKGAAEEGGDILCFVYENRELFALLHRDRLTNVLVQFVMQAEVKNQPTGDEAFIAYYVTYGYLGVIRNWYETGFALKPVEVAAIIYNVYAEIVRGYIRKSQQEQQGQ